VLSNIWFSVSCFGVGLHAASLITVALALPTIMHTGTGVASDLAQPDHTAARGQLSTEPAPV